MNEEKIAKKGEAGRDTRREEAGIGKKLRQLYRESEIVKMNGLKAFVGIGKDGEPILEADLAKNAQVVLKCIELQLRILGEGGDEEASLPGPSIFWEVLSSMPETGPLIKRAIFREKLAARLRAAALSGEAVR